MKILIITLLTIFSLVGCVVENGKTKVDIFRKKKDSSIFEKASVSNIQIINNQLIITGKDLNNVLNVKIDGSSFAENFSIETKSETQIIANSLRAFSFDVSKVFNLILSDANASATFPIDFSLCNATLNGRKFDCSLTAQNNNVLSYDSSKSAWVPRAINDLSYKGVIDAADLAALPTPVAGNYYIISVADGIYNIGDWAIYNGTVFDKIDNSTSVTKVHGRVGDVVAAEGDYTLDQLLDVDLSVAPVAGQVLKFVGGKWIASTDLTAGAGSVITTSIADGAVTDAKIDTVSASKITGTITSAQILDGTIVNADVAAGAAIAYSKLNIPDGAIPAIKISGLPTGTAIITSTITNGDTTHSPDGNSIYNALLTKLGLGGGTLNVGATITGLPTLPLAGSEATSRDYVNAQDLLKVSKTGDTMSGILDLESDLRMKKNGNFVAIKPHATTTAYTLVLPINDGANGEILSTDGNGNTSWIAPATGGGGPVDTDDVTEATNLYFTKPRVLATDLLGLSTGVAGPITATDTILSALGKLQYQATTLNSNGQWIKTGNDISYAAGDVSVEKNFKLKDSTSNYILLKAPTTVTATYTLTMPTTAGSANQVLQTNGAGGVLSWATITDASVQAFAKSVLPTCSTGQVLKSDGSTFSCVTDATGAGSFSGATNRAMATDGSGALIVSTTTSTELGYVNGVTSSIQTQLNAKEGTLTAGTATQYYKGNKTWATLDTLAVTENNNLYFTTARAKAATVADAVADAITDVAPSQNAVYDALALKISTTGGTLTMGTISGVPTPANPSDVANKAYVDSLSTTVGALTTTNVAEGTRLYFTEPRVLTTALTSLNTGAAGPITATDTVLSAMGKLQYQATTLNSNGQWIKSGNDISYAAGDVSVDKNLKLRDSGSNYVLLKAPTTVTATYTLTMPATAGSTNQVLQTNGAGGVLSWATITDASVQAFAKATLPTCNTGEVLKSNGTTFSCVTDTTGPAAFSGTGSMAVVTAAGGALATHASTTATEIGYVNGVTSSIQTQLNAKQSSSTLATSVLAIPLTGFSAANSAITATDTILQGFNKAQGQLVNYIDKRAAATETVLSTVTFNGTGLLRSLDPIGLTDVANRQWVEAQIAANGLWTKSGTDVYRASGSVGIGLSTTPRSILEVNGTITGKTSTLNATSTINFLNGNIQHTNADCGSFALTNLNDGASYTFIVKGTAVATCSFTATDKSATALTVHLPPGHGATTTGKHTLYSFLVSGGDVYFAWIPGY